MVYNLQLIKCYTHQDYAVLLKITVIIYTKAYNKGVIKSQMFIKKCAVKQTCIWSLVTFPSKVMAVGYDL